MVELRTSVVQPYSPRLFSAIDHGLNRLYEVFAYCTVNCLIIVSLHTSGVCIFLVFPFTLTAFLSIRVAHHSTAKIHSARCCVGTSCCFSAFLQNVEVPYLKGTLWVSVRMFQNVPSRRVKTYPPQHASSNPRTIIVCLG